MLDIRDFGADPSGVQDSWQALQTAINAAASQINQPAGLTQGVDGTVYVPAGTFWISKQILIPPIATLPGFQQPLRIVGSGGSNLNMTGGVVRAVMHCSLSISSGVATLTTTDPGGFKSTPAPGDVGLFVAGLGIPSGTTIRQVISSTTATLWTPGTINNFNPPNNDFTITLLTPKIYTSGYGTLSMDNIVLEDLSQHGGIGDFDTPAPFIQTIRTILLLTNVSFVGVHVGSAWNARNITSLGSVTKNSTTLTFPSAVLQQSDVGAAVFGSTPSGTITPDNTYISAVDTSGLFCTMSRAATATSSSVSTTLIYCYQDALIFGGPGDVGDDGTPNALFAGFGTTIDKCSFAWIRRAAFFRSAANVITFRSNDISYGNGAGFTWEAAIDVAGGAAALIGNAVAGTNVICGNDVELNYYLNGIRLDVAQQNTIECNYLNDTGATPGTNSYLLTGNAWFNLVLGGAPSGTMTDMTGGRNTLIVPNPLFPSGYLREHVLGMPVLFRSDVTQHGINASWLGLNVPSSVSVTAQGTLGMSTTSYQYKVSAIRHEQTTDLYLETMLSGATAAVTNNTPLTSVNYNQVSIPNVPGATLYNVYDGSNNYLATVGANGATTTVWNDVGATPGSNPAVSGYAAGTKLVVQDWQGQTGDLQEWQDNSGTVLAKVDASGNGTFANIAANGTITATGTISTSAGGGVLGPEGSFNTILPYSGGTIVVGPQNISASGVTAVELGTGTWNNSTGAATAVAITPAFDLGTASGNDATALRISATYDVGVGSAGNTIDLVIDRQETRVGSGSNRFCDFRVSGTTKFAIFNSGTILAPKLSPISGTAGVTINDGSSNAAVAGVIMCTGTLSQSSGTYTAVKIAPTYNQPGAVTTTDLLVNRVETSVSGSQHLLDLQVSNASKFNVDNKGNVTSTGNWASPVATPTYGPSITPDAFAGIYQKITVTNGTAFTINSPSNPSAGEELVFDIVNSSGGVMGAVTWNAVFKLAGAFVNPASGKRRTISFYYDGSNWVEMARAAADI